MVGLRSDCSIIICLTTTLAECEESIAVIEQAALLEASIGGFENKS